jgi:hypothetical protein
MSQQIFLKIFIFNLLVKGRGGVKKKAMKNKNYIITLCAVLATATSVSAAITFGAGTLVSTRIYTRSIILNGTTIGSLGTNITGSGANWSAIANGGFAGAAVASNGFEMLYINNTSASTQPFNAVFTISLNPGVALTGNIRFGSGFSAVIGSSNGNVLANLSVNQPGTLALTTPASWSGVTAGAYTAGTVLPTNTAVGNNGVTLFSSWSVAFAPTNTFSFTQTNAGVNTTNASSESIGIRFDDAVLVPESSSLLLTGLGALGLLARRRRN